MVHGSAVPSSVHAPAPPPTVIPPANPLPVILLPRLPSILARPFHTPPVPLPSPPVLHHSTHAPLPSSPVLLPRPMRRRIRSTTSTTRSSLCCTRVATAADGATTMVVAQHASLSKASSLINSLGNSREGNPDRDNGLSMLFSKKPLAQAGWATGPAVAAARRGGPLPRARMEGRRGASAADERAADPAGDSAGAARRPARVHIHLPAALPGVRVPPPVHGHALLCSRLPAINARHRTRTRYQHRPSWKVPEDPPPSSPTSVMAMGLPDLHCCRLPARGSLTPLCVAFFRGPRLFATPSSLEAQGILTHLCFIIFCVFDFLLPLRCWSTECLALKRPVQISCVFVGIELSII
jgi:hypothetical protein